MGVDVRMLDCHLCHQIGINIFVMKGLLALKTSLDFSSSKILSGEVIYLLNHPQTLDPTGREQ